ncbi:MAG: hypothetical protein ACI837_003109 [Crocinitomicaceae bacterium]|jgi:hypothetical protein
MRYTWLIFIFSIVLHASCSKEKVQHPYAGTYDCSVINSSWSMTGGGGGGSSTEQLTFELLLIEDSIDVLGAKVAVDEIAYGKSFFFGYSSNYISFNFEKDSIFISRHSGGLGGGSTTSYAGRKIN